MLAEIRELGFHRAELGPGIRQELVPGILRAVEEKLVEISSVHNFCPLPRKILHSAPNLFQPSARSRSERDLWLLHTRHTLEFAAQVGAPPVIMHSGSLSFRFRNPIPLLENPESLTEHAREELLARLQQKAAKTYPRIHEAFESIASDALRHGLTLGIENRKEPYELPLDREYADFLTSLSSILPTAPWYDSGHGQIKENLGLLNIENHLATHSAQIIGWHLHDVDYRGREHRRLGSGSVDFSKIAPYIRPQQAIVLELHPKLDTEEIVASRDFLLDLLT